jgi:D-3-phosphoglycerate dehydrogenase
MAPNAKRVFYVKYLSGPVFAQILATRPDIQLDRLENETPDADADVVLSQAHAYQIGASRQVIGKHLQVTDALRRVRPAWWRCHPTVPATTRSTSTPARATA